MKGHNNGTLQQGSFILECVVGMVLLGMVTVFAWGYLDKWHALQVRASICTLVLSIRELQTITQIQNQVCVMVLDVEHHKYTLNGKTYIFPQGL